MKLKIELVPQTVWYSSLAKLLHREVWRSIREEIGSKRGWKCEICNSEEKPMNLHEIWDYDDVNHIQKLEGFQILCRQCHWIKHIGLAGIMADEGKLDYDKLVKHYCDVNQCSKKEFDKHREQAFEKWLERSGFEWKQDFGDYKGYINNEKNL
jgi:hypothetical protein